MAAIDEARCLICGGVQRSVECWYDAPEHIWAIPVSAIAAALDDDLMMRVAHIIQTRLGMWTSVEVATEVMTEFGRALLGTEGETT